MAINTAAFTKKQVPPAQERALAVGTEVHKRIERDLVGRSLAANAGGDIIGAVTFWSLGGTRVKREAMRVALENVGLGFAMPKNPKPQAVLRMAVDVVRRSSNEHVVFDRVSDTSTMTTYAMSVRATDEAAELATYAHKTRVRVSKVDGKIAIEDPLDPILLRVEQAYLEITNMITTSELGLVLINALRGRRHMPGLSAVNLRGDTGGVYFVPAANVDRLDTLAKLVDEIAVEGAITVWPIPRGDRTIAQATSAIRSDFVDRIKAAKEDVATLLEEIAADRTTDPEGRRVMARAKSFAGIRARISVYSELLGDMRGTLDDQLGELKAAIEERIGATMNDFDAPADAPDDDEAE